MEQQLAASPVETIRFLTDYREVTHRLYQLLRAAVVEDVEMEGLTDLLAERDRLIEAFGGRQPDRSAEGVGNLLAEIQQMDTVLSNKMQMLLKGTQAKMQGVQEQKRGTSAYQNEYASSAMYFDRKK